MTDYVIMTSEVEGMSDGEHKEEEKEVRVAVSVVYKERRHAEAVAGSLAVDRDLKGCVHHEYKVDPETNTMTA